MSELHSLDIVGHRGARGEAPENTLAGFQRALRAGVHEVELDVRLSVDGHLIVVHDADVDRTTWHTGSVHRHSLAELGLMDARRNTPGWHSPLGIPSLAEVLDFCPDDTRFQFEVKAVEGSRQHAIAHALRMLIEQRRVHDRIVVTSSDTGFLKKMRLVEPHVTLGYIAQYAWDQPLRRLHALDCGWLIAHRNLVGRRLVDGAHRRGARVSVWTVNDTRKAERMRALGVDSLITDYPARMMAHFFDAPDASTALS